MSRFHRFGAQSGLCVLMLALAVPAFARNANVTIINHSDWEIHRLFLSSTDDDGWGPDQLGDEVIGTDESFLLKGIPCDSYDVMLVDEDDDVCVVPEVDICGGHESWTITSELLLACQDNS